MALEGDDQRHPRHRVAQRDPRLRGRDRPASLRELRRPLLVTAGSSTALDATTQAEILSLLGRLQADIGMGVLFITHAMGVVAEMADRVAVLRNGTMEETGPTAEVLRRSQHRPGAPVDPRLTVRRGTPARSYRAEGGTLAV